MILKALFLILVFRTATAQYREAAQIDGIATTDRTKCIDHEKTLASLLTTLSANITSLVTSLESEFLSKDLCTALKNLNAEVQRQLTINNYVAYTNISTCGDINYKITTFDFEKLRTLRLINWGRTNFTRLYQLYAQTVAFSGQIISSSYYTTYQTYSRQMTSYFTEVNKYLGITLPQSYSNTVVNGNLLTVFRKTYCTCLKTAKMTGNSTLNYNVAAVEAPLIKYQSTINNLSTTASSLVKAAYTAVTSEYLTNFKDLTV